MCYNILDRDYSYLFDDSAKSSGVELDRIRYRTAVPVEANKNDGTGTGNTLIKIISSDFNALL